MKKAHQKIILKEAGEHDESSAVSFHDVTVAYDEKPVLWDIDLDIPVGRRVAIVGPNGAGKSTLLKSALGILKPLTGHIKILGVNNNHYKNEIGYLPQREEIDWTFPISALDVVCMGSYRRSGWFKKISNEEKEKGRLALQRMGIESLSNRPIGELSGGQQQRVFISRILLQNAKVVFMDEPFTGVDATTEKIISNILKELVEENKTVISVHHDLQTVADYFDHIVFINLRVIDSGPTKTVFTKENLKKTYGGRLTVLDQVSTSFKKR